jgi:hypothetical protein
MITKLAGWALVAFAAFYLFTDPDGAAALVMHLLGLLHGAASSLSTFASHF